MSQWPEGEYDIAKIRKLLMAAFMDDADLRRFCQDNDDLRPVVVQFGSGQGLGDMVAKVIDYCQTHLLWDRLLAAVNQENPRQYAYFEPYQRPPAPPLPPPPPSLTRMPWQWLAVVLAVVLVLVLLVWQPWNANPTPPTVVPTAPPTAALTTPLTVPPTMPPTHTPTGTSTPTPTPTNTSTSTPTPTDTPTPTPSETSSHTPMTTPTRVPIPTPTQPQIPTGHILDDFEDYDSDSTLRSAYGINTAWGKNVGQLSLASPPNVGTGNWSAAFYYEIKNPAPDDYAGFERSFPTQNWQPYSVMRVWVQSDRSPRDLLIQFREVSGEVWRYRSNLSTFSVVDFRLPLNEGTFQHADWSTYQNGRIDLGAIEYYGFYLGDGGQGSGIIYIDDIRLE